MNAQKANNAKEKVRELQRKLYLAAKKSSKRKFHALHDKIYRKDVLLEAWKRVKANKGASGIDEISIGQIEQQGIEKFLGEIETELRDGKYHPKAVRRTYIPKGDKEKRPLGIPTVRDRVVQMATKIVIEPVFEADFLDCSYGFRPKRSAKEALERVRKDLNNKGWWVVEADIKGYFDNIDHEKLMLMVKQRISDRKILKLINQWLKAGVMEGGVKTESEIGSPQGGVISPLLANIFLHYLDVKWDKHYKHLGKLVRYCDDFVVICKTKKDAEQTLKAVEFIMKRLELTLHPTKTKMLNMWDGVEGFDFLGFHHRRKRTETSTGKVFSETHQFPSKKAKAKMRENIRNAFSSRSMLLKSIDEMVKILNPKIVGMRNYYGLKNAKVQLNKIDFYILKKCVIWFNYKTQKNRKHANFKVIRQKFAVAGLKTLVA